MVSMCSVNSSVKCFRTNTQVIFIAIIWGITALPIHPKLIHINFDEYLHNQPNSEKTIQTQADIITPLNLLKMIN